LNVFKEETITFILKMCCNIHCVVNFYNADVVHSCRALGANPKIVNYNASAVKIYNSNTSQVRFECKLSISPFEKTVVHYSAGFVAGKFGSRRIDSYVAFFDKY
jgi:hypothetical protein